MIKNLPSREFDFEDTVSEVSSSSDVNSVTDSQKKKDDKDKKTKKPDSQQSGSKFTHSRFSSNVEDLDIDVEGAEKLVLDGATELLKAFDAFWIISTHSHDLYKECEYIMKKNGYEVESLFGFHHELICKKK